MLSILEAKLLGSPMAVQRQNTTGESAPCAVAFLLFSVTHCHLFCKAPCPQGVCSPILLCGSSSPKLPLQNGEAGAEPGLTSGNQVLHKDFFFKPPTPQTRASICRRGARQRWLLKSYLHRFFNSSLAFVLCGVLLSLGHPS